MRSFCAVPVLVVMAVLGPASAFAQDSVFLEDLTWTEVRDALASGKTTVIIPTGGTEQNGPHMVLGKHNYLVRYKAGEVAKRLGNALVAPVVAYVPEGDVDPPTGHMRFSGTITTPNRRVCKGAGVRGPELQAARLPRHRASRRQRWQSVSTAVGGRSPQQGMGADARARASVERLLSRPWRRLAETAGCQREDVGSHASIHDTASLLFLNPAMIRRDKLAPGKAGDASGVVGNPESRHRRGRSKDS